MSNYRRLISYIYAYEGGVKGKNIGFAKIESRGIQCKISVNVKKVYVGGHDCGVFLLSGDREIFLGKIFIRNGAGEFRTVVSSSDVEQSGCSMEQCYGLSVHDVEDAWQSYTTIWEDAVTQAAEVELGEVTSQNRLAQEAQREGKVVKPEERFRSVAAQIEEEMAREEERAGQPPQETRAMEAPDRTGRRGGEDTELRPRDSAAEERTDPMAEGPETEEREFALSPEPKNWKSESDVENGRALPEAENQDSEPGSRSSVPEAETPRSEKMPEQEAVDREREPDSGSSGRDSAREPRTSRRERAAEPEPQRREGMPEPGVSRGDFMTESEQWRVDSGLEPGMPGRNSGPKPEIFRRERAAEPEPRQPDISRKEEKTEPPLVGSIKDLDLQEDGGTGEEENHERVWGRFKREHAKIQAFDYDKGCEILTIKPQDIGLMPRDNWVFGNNSFLLHGYYNYRYLILARLNNPGGIPRYLLGIPGHYYSNEKYMASMFGFPNFVLSKKQPAGDGRFGYWYTDIRLGT